MSTFSNKTFDSALYAKFRPVYNKAAFDLIYDYHAAKGGQFDIAADVGTGTGQVASQLADRYKQVHGTDLSARMLESAIKKPNVDYQTCPAEELPFANESIDTLTTFEALHYFNHQKYFAEVHRVLKPNGTIGILAYSYPRIKGEPEMTARFEKHAFETLDKYFDKGREAVDNLYRDIHIPFEDITRYFSPAEADVEKIGKVAPEPLLEQRKMTLKDFEQYCKTWSGYAKYLETHSDDPVDELMKDMAKIANVKDLETYYITAQWATVLILATKK